MGVEELFGLTRTGAAEPWVLLVVAALAGLAVWAWSERRKGR